MCNASRYCFLCPIHSLQMFGFPDFCGRTYFSFSPYPSGGLVYVLLQFNKCDGATGGESKCVKDCE